MIVPAPRPSDRRTRRSRASLQRSLLTLVAAKPYDAITIDDITEAADVARATFYAHYRDKAALLGEALAEMTAELAARVAVLTPRGETVYAGAAITEVFAHAAEHRDLHRLVLSGEAGAAPRAALIAAFRAHTATILAELAEHFGQQPRAPMTRTTTALVGALLLTIEVWLAGELDGTPAELAALFVRGQTGGLEWALGFDPGEFMYRAPAG